MTFTFSNGSGSMTFFLLLMAVTLNTMLMNAFSNLLASVNLNFPVSLTVFILRLVYPPIFFWAVLYFQLLLNPVGMSPKKNEFFK